MTQSTLLVFNDWRPVCDIAFGAWANILTIFSPASLTAVSATLVDADLRLDRFARMAGGELVDSFNATGTVFAGGGTMQISSRSQKSVHST